VHKLLLPLFLVSSLSPAVLGQQVEVAGVTVAAAPVVLPDAPQPQYVAMQAGESSSAALFGMADEPQTAATPQTATAAQTTTPPQDETPAQRKARAEAELKAEEQQRMVGIVPNFMAVNSGKALPITPGQKFELFFKGAFDSYQFALAGLDAGISQAQGSDRGFRGGIGGYARRYGSNYGDNFDGNFWGNAVLPSLFHQDPRYFRMGHGTVLHRALYSISTTFRTRGDSGNWQPAYSNLLGNMIGAAISNVYYPNYPDDERGLYPTLRRGLSVTYQGTIGGLLEEFYPDLSDLYKRHRARKQAERVAAGVQAQPEQR